ncbi:MAG TPA: hypothetical protein VHK88_00385 [Aquihabitans sp.]|jgi:hypothetical protein|nr:hypothetical protein [Aquihabitans sp.]
MTLIAILALVLAIGVGLAWRWAPTPYRALPPGSPGEDVGVRTGSVSARPDLRGPAVAYLRGVSVVLVAGFWAGLLVTGPAVRLAMRLLAVTGGDRAQGMVTEANEVVGEIDLGGTIGLIIFGGILPGLLSAAIYLLVRRWLPEGRLGGLVFGLAHLVIGATRLDPLRPDNPDFGLVGPGWLSVLAFGLACILHGVAVAAFANRFSQRHPSPAGSARSRVRAGLPLVPPALLLIPGFVLLVPLLVGLLVAVASARCHPIVRSLRNPATVLIGRLALGAVVVAFLPWTIIDLREILVA